MSKYTSLTKKSKYLYEVVYDTNPTYENQNNFYYPSGCTSFVKDGKLYRNLDWYYSDTLEFIIVTPLFKGMSFIDGVTEETLTDDIIARLPSRVSDGVNTYGIKVSTHVLFNDFNFTGHGNRSVPVTSIPLIILSELHSMSDISTIQSYLDDIYVPDSVLETGYLCQFMVTDGTTTYVIVPPTTNTGTYELINATSNPKLSNFRWVDRKIVHRNDDDMQTHPVGVERWNMIEDTTTLEDLRYTLAYQNSNRLSEFIGIDGTDKTSSDSALEAIYNRAQTAYEERTRTLTENSTWQTMHSVVYGGNKMEHLWVQEDYLNDFGSSKERKFIYDIKLDLVHSITSNFMHIMQYDDGLSIIRANIFEDYQPVDVTKFTTIVLRLKKPNGNAVVYVSNTDTDKFKINFNSVDIFVDMNMTDTVGRCSAVLDFIDSDGHIQTATFILIIHRNPVQKDESSTNIPIDIEETLLAEIARATEAENSKVDKVEGKSLVDDSEIEKLRTVEEYANANKIEEIVLNGAALPIDDKSVDLGYITTSREIEILDQKIDAEISRAMAAEQTNAAAVVTLRNDYTADFASISSSVSSLRTNVTNLSNSVATLSSSLSNKQDKITYSNKLSTDLLVDGSMSRVFTTIYASKLNGIAIGATKVEPSTTNGNIKINGQEVTVYAGTAEVVYTITKDTNPGEYLASYHLTKDGINVGETINIPKSIYYSGLGIIIESDNTITVDKAVTDTWYDAVGTAQTLVTSLANGQVATNTIAISDVQFGLESLRGRVTTAENDLAALYPTVEGHTSQITTINSKLSGIESGAQVNKIEKVQLNGTDLTITNKTVNVVVPAASSYSVVKDTNPGEYSAVYHLTKDGANVGVPITIPKDLVVKSGSVVTVSGKKYIRLVLVNDEYIDVPVDSLVDVYTSGTGITVDATNRTISINRSVVDTYYDAAGTAQTKVNALANGQVATNTSNISSLSSRVSDIEDDYLVSSDKTELQNKINVVDGKASQNEEDIADLQSYDAALNTRITAIESKEASWDAKQDAISLTNRISADYIAETTNRKFVTLAEKTKISEIEAGAQVNKIEAIKLNGSVVTISNKTVDLGSIASSEALNALTTRVTNAETAIGGHDNDISDLRSTTSVLDERTTTNADDIAELQDATSTISTQVNGIANDVVTLQTTTVKTTDYNAFKTETYTRFGTVDSKYNELYDADLDLSERISTNADDIADLQSSDSAQNRRLTTLEGSTASISGRVTAIENDYLKAADKTALQNAINGKASQTDLTALAGRVTRAEGAIDGHTADISDLAGMISGKVDTSEYNTFKTATNTHLSTLDTKDANNAKKNEANTFTQNQTVPSITFSGGTPIEIKLYDSRGCYVFGNQDGSEMMFSGRVTPFYDNSYSLGREEFRWKDIYLSSGINLGSARIEDNGGGGLKAIASYGTGSQQTMFDLYGSALYPGVDVRLPSGKTFYLNGDAGTSYVKSDEFKLAPGGNLKMSGGAVYFRDNDQYTWITGSNGNITVSSINGKMIVPGILQIGNVELTEAKLQKLLALLDVMEAK